MKKQIFTLLAFVILSQAYAQNGLRELISGKKGISNHFTRLETDEQIVFDPSRAKNIFSLDPNSDLVLMNKKSDRSGFTHYRYYQTYKNIPVENSMYVVNTKNGKAIGLNGSIIIDFDERINDRFYSSLTAKQAIDIAVKYVNAEKYMWQIESMEKAIKVQKGDSKATYYPAAGLVWYNNGPDINPRDLRLAYKVDVYARKPLSRAYYFVDVQTGKILGKKDEIFYTDATGTAYTAWSGSQVIHSNFNGTNYRLRDLTKGDGIITLHGETAARGNNYVSSAADWTLPGDDQAALDAHYGVSQTYSFYMTNFGRNSYDDAGTALYSYVNDPTYLDNAFWDGSSMNFNKRSTGDPGGVTGIDVCGHELTHGVTQETSNLNYSYESGAINESMSDIFGKSVQFWSKPGDIDWKLSNDMGWIIRDMSDPNAEGQPDTYLGTNWYTGAGDNGGVHTNSGVGNFFFYLLVEGGSGTNDNGNSYSVTGIGLNAADQILYRTNIAYLTPSSQYADWRTACISAAIDLFGAGSNEVVQVQNAWHAAGIGSAYGMCDDPNVLTASGITGAGATLNWSDVGAASYRLRWKPSSGSNWTAVSGITTNYYNLGDLAPGTSYDFKVRALCGGGINSTFSSVASFMTAAGRTYCSSKGNSTGFEYIDKVVLNSVTNQSGDDGGYHKYTNINIPLTAGNTYRIKLTPGYPGGSYTEDWTVYIDYNQNGFFNDPGEIVATGSGSGHVKLPFHVKLSALNGATRMRVQMHYGGSITDPCSTFDYGEVEDYKITINGGSGFGADDKIIADNKLNTDIKDKKTGVVVSPNPVSGYTVMVSYQLAEAGKVTLKLFDMFGRTVQNINLGNQTAGYHTYRLTNINRMNSGNYFITVEQGNQLIGRNKLIVSK